MSSESFSILLWCRNDPQADIIQLRAVSVSTGEDIHFKDAGFLLRVSIDTDTLVVRCMIRHIASGNEAHVQGGPALREFVKANLLKERQSGK
jgi:hypothetical protein